MKAALLVPVLCWLALSSQAQPVYRCGPEGREYSSQPCENGKLLDAADKRSDAERRAAENVARKDAELADQLTAERRSREAQATRTAAGFHAAPPPAQLASGPHHGKKHKKKTASDKPMVYRGKTPPSSSR